MFYANKNILSWTIFARVLFCFTRVSILKNQGIRNVIFKLSDPGTWMAQLVKHLTHDLSSGLDLRVLSSSPALGSALGMKPTLKKNKTKLSDSLFYIQEGEHLYHSILMETLFQRCAKEIPASPCMPNNPVRKFFLVANLNLLSYSLSPVPFRSFLDIKNRCSFILSILHIPTFLHLALSLAN